jgi:hypothetical protein
MLRGSCLVVLVVVVVVLVLVLFVAVAVAIIIEFQVPVTMFCVVQIRYIVTLHHCDVNISQFLRNMDQSRNK